MLPKMLEGELVDGRRKEESGELELSLLCSRSDLSTRFGKARCLPELKRDSLQVRRSGLGSTESNREEKEKKGRKEGGGFSENGAKVPLSLSLSLSRRVAGFIRKTVVSESCIISQGT